MQITCVIEMFGYNSFEMTQINDDDWPIISENE